MSMRQVSFLDGRSQRGAVTLVLVAAVAILLLMAVAAWFLILRPHNATGPVSTQAPTVAAGVTAPVAAPPPADVGNMSVDELLQQARAAMREQRLLAPAGNNAFEFYLKVLEKDPNNRVAQDALRETFPFAANAAEQEINAGNFAEARRQIAVLTTADPGNYTLTILRSKLDARQELAARAEEQDKLLAEQAAAQEIAAAQAAAQAAEQARVEAAAAAAPPEPAVAVTQPAQRPTATPEPTPPPQPMGETRGPVLVKTVPAYYPPEARRRRLQGSVVVEFNVDANGNVVNARVVNATRARTFNDAAITAVEQYSFDPALRNGAPVRSATLSQRVVFSLN